MVVGEAGWKQSFLGLLDSIDGFDKLAARSRENNNQDDTCIIAGLKPDAMRIISMYDKKELVQARHYYNNSHLIHFWKWHCAWMRKRRTHLILRDYFPVYSVEANRSTGGIQLGQLKPEDFERYFYWKVSNCPTVYRACRQEDIEKHVDKWSGHEHGSLEQILGRLNLLRFHWKECTTYLYNVFLGQQYVNCSSCWGDYKIHYFLDLFLYDLPEQNNLGAVFDKIFFSNNMVELEVYLRNLLNIGAKLRVDDIASFLQRQRKYYVQLALVIDHEQNAFLNNHKNLLFYDTDRKVVVMPEISDDLRACIHNILIKQVGVIKSDGCPFAKSKGVSENAVVELYSWFDNLMLQLVKRWIDMPCDCSKPIRRG